jgi:hypothetical protein
VFLRPLHTQIFRTRQAHLEMRLNHFNSHKSSDRIIRCQPSPENRKLSKCRALGACASLLWSPIFRARRLNTSSSGRNRNRMALRRRKESSRHVLAADEPNRPCQNTRPRKGSGTNLRQKHLTWDQNTVRLTVSKRAPVYNEGDILTGLHRVTIENETELE